MLAETSPKKSAMIDRQKSQEREPADSGYGLLNIFGMNTNTNNSTSSKQYSPVKARQFESAVKSNS
jgi:hypothetical protein